jgi:predicted neuraminidase
MFSKDWLCNPCFVRRRPIVANRLPGWIVLAPLVMLALPRGGGAQDGLTTRGFIFERGPYPTNHSPTIAETTNGLLAAWFGGPRARDPENSIYSARYNGTNWHEPRKVVEGWDGSSRCQCWNPVLFQPSHGPLLLFYKTGASPETWRGMLTTSTNAGATWSEPRRLPDGFVGPVRNKPVELSDGSLLCGSSTEDGGWSVRMERALKSAGNWEKTEPLNDPLAVEAIQPTILAHDRTTIQILCRTKQGFVAESWSKDAGTNWGPIALTRIPNPNSAIDAVRLADGRFLLVYNHSRSERNVLNLALSRDGRNWETALVIEKGQGEFSYPAIIQTRAKRVHITYSWNRQRIRHVIVDPAKLKSE